MVRAAKYVAGVLAIWGVACASYPVAQHVAVLPMPPSLTMLGQAKCDVENFPYILVDTTQTAAMQAWLAVHEKVHVGQMNKFPGGCKAFIKRYGTDEAFRLESEATAYCTVFFAQLAAREVPEPDKDSILWRLMNRYPGSWTEDDAKAAMPCWR